MPKKTYLLRDVTVSTIKDLEDAGYAEDASAVVDKAIAAIARALHSPNPAAQPLLDELDTRIRAVLSLLTAARIDPNSDGPDFPAIGVTVTTPDGEGKVVAYDARQDAPYGVEVGGKMRWYAGEDVEIP